MYSSDHTRAAFVPTHWQPQALALRGAMQDLKSRRVDVDEGALGVVVLEEGRSHARLAFGSAAALTVGRHCGTDLLLERADSSLRHLVFARDGEGVVVFDLASTHGCAAPNTRAGPGVPLIVAVGDAVVVAVVVAAGQPFPEVTPAMVRDARPLRVRLVVPEVPAAMLLLGRAPITRQMDRSPRRPQSLRVDGLTQPLMLGRDPRNDVVIADEHVSRVHAVILPMSGRPLLIDAGSSNGTHVVHGRHHIELGVTRRSFLLSPGDRVGLGDVWLRVVGNDDGDVYDGRLWRGGTA